MRETRVLLLRHAETSAPDRFHGAESDVGLSPVGQTQAETVARSLAVLRPDALYSSGMRRARATAAPIGQACGLVPGVIEALHERRIGALSGRLLEEGWSEYAEAMSRWMAGVLNYSHEGGESYAMIRDRVLPAFQALAERHPGETIVVVAHGVVIRVLLTSLIEGYGPEDFGRIGIAHVAVNDLTWDGERWTSADSEGSLPEVRP